MEREFSDAFKVEGVMPEGLYERLIDAELAELLERTDMESETSGVDVADMPHVLASHLKDRIERALEQTKPDDRLGLANKLLGELPEPTQLQVYRERKAAKRRNPRTPSPAQLLSLYKPRFASVPSRPEIPIAEVALLTNSPTDPELATELRTEMLSADSVDLLGSFIKWTGIRVLMEGLEDLGRRGVPIRVLTTTYIGSTERKALDELVRRTGATVKVNYHSASTKLHAKAWIFHRNTGFSTAYIGSSNLSQSALIDGLEWNVRVAQAATPHVLEKFSATFESYWQSADFELYDPDTDGERLDQALITNRFNGSDRDDGALATVSPLHVRPYPHQEIMLEQLAAERESGHHANLIVAATGTGKTVVAALDYQRLIPALNQPGMTLNPRLLFVAHRKEILQQALQTYRDVLRDGSFGELLVDQYKPRSGDYVFASVQSLQRDMGGFESDRFDVIVIDEFHHAEAPSYRKILDYFRSKELLGMTATPERADGVNVAVAFFDGRIASELRLWDALEADLLVPFHYFGISDGTDLRSLTFSGGSYKQDELSRYYLANRSRAMKIVEATNRIVTNVADMKALGFCVTVEHAHFMADVFNDAGIPARALSGQSSREERQQGLDDLRVGRVKCLFAVDIFNEGLDIPDVDTVIMARPTQSATIFLQQLGRGLRRTPTKPVLTVLDFVGHQHANFRFDIKLRALTGVGRKKLTKAVEAGFPFLPAGSQIVLDKVAKEEVLANLKSKLALTGGQMVDDVHVHANGNTAYTLREYLYDADRSLSDVYARSTFKQEGETYQWSWHALSSLAFDNGHRYAQTSVVELDLIKRIRNFTHVDDAARITGYRTVLQKLAQTEQRQFAERSLYQLGEYANFAPMLFFTLWPTGDPGELLEKLWDVAHSRALSSEIEAILDVRADLSRTLARPLPGRLAECPIQSHARYSREELLAGFGVGIDDRDKPGNFREGVKYVKEKNTDLLLVTLQKSEADYSPTTMYRDYAISPTRFHWESQSTTSANSPTGQRYINHESRGSDVVLFVRESKDGEIGTQPYMCLGTARYVSHSGSNPMAIEWELDRPMPAEMLGVAKLVS